MSVLINKLGQYFIINLPTEEISINQKFRSSVQINFSQQFRRVDWKFIHWHVPKEFRLKYSMDLLLKCVQIWSPKTIFLTFNVHYKKITCKRDLKSQFLKPIYTSVGPNNEKPKRPHIETAHREANKLLFTG